MPKATSLKHMLPILGAHNIAGINFSLDALALLNKGLKFIGTPPVLTEQQLAASLNRFKRSVRLRCQFGRVGGIPKFRVANPAFRPQPAPAAVEAFLRSYRDAAVSRHQAMTQHKCRRSNLTHAERQALKELKAQHGIIIKPADKNLGLVIMRECDYRDSVRAHVSDTRVYRDVTDTIDQCVQSACSKLECLVSRYSCLLGEDVCKYALQGLNMQEPAHLYILPKLHKMQQMAPPIIGRPIAACHSWVTTNISKVVCDLLNEALSKFSTILLDRTDLVSMLEHTPVSKDTWLLTFDVESLYPNIDQVACAEACAEAVDGDSRTKTMVHEFVLYVLQNNIVQSEGRYYSQQSGGAMGNNLLPPAAQVYLAIKWEGVAKQQLGEHFPAVFKRFLDDGFVLLDGDEQHLLEFVAVLQGLLPNIRITYTYSKYKVEYLDLVIYKDGFASEACCLKVRTHQKVLNKYLYIPYDSFHQKGVFKSFMHAELIRYVITNTDACWYECIVEKFKHRLMQRGYPSQLIAASVAAVSFSDRHRYLQHNLSGCRDAGEACAFVVPYVQGVPEMQLQQLLHSMYISHPEVHEYISKPLVCFMKSSSLGAMLVKAHA